MPDAEASISEEPGARKGHAGICAGAVWETGRPTAMVDVLTARGPEQNSSTMDFDVVGQITKIEPIAVRLARKSCG